MRTTVEQLAPVAEKAAEYMYKNNIRAVFVPGPGAQTASYMIKQAWKNNPSLSSKPMPHFFAMGKIKEKFRNANRDESKKWVESRLGKHRNTYQNSSVIIMDDCYHTGVAMGKMQRALLDLGFKQIKTGAFTVQHKLTPGLDFAGLKCAMCPTFKEFRRQQHLWAWSSKAQKLSVGKHFRESIRNIFRHRGRKK